jgi:hypothetical protein
MSATIVWSVDNMPYNTEPVNGFSQVVSTVNWRCTGYQTVGDVPYTYSLYGPCSFPPPATGDASFIQYSSLQPSQVIAWCWANGVNQAATEAAINANIANQISPTVTQGALPWSTT